MTPQSTIFFNPNSDFSHTSQSKFSLFLFLFLSEFFHEKRRKMGKYIRKSKIDGEASIALMDVSPSSLGVLTRAKSLALQQRRLQKPSSSSSLPPTSPSPNPPSKQKKQKQQMNDCSSGGGGGGSYLQLRSRRLQKKPPIVVIRSSKRRKQQRRTDTCVGGRNPNPNNKNPPNLDSIRGDGSRSDSVDESVVFGKEKELIGEINKDLCVETSFGENFLELEGTTQRYHFYFNLYFLIFSPQF